MIEEAERSNTGLCQKVRVERPFVVHEAGVWGVFDYAVPNERALDMTRPVGCFLLTLQYSLIAV